MEKKFRNPALLIGVAMLMLVTGGFLTVLQVGVSSRQGTGISHGFSFRGGEKKEPSYFDDLERGSDVIKSKTSAFFDDIFGGGSSQAPAQDAYASAAGNRYRGYSADEIAGKYAPEDDAFEKYYQENYGSGGSSYSPSSSYGGGDAGTFYGGGGGGGSSQDIPRGGPAAGGKEGAAAGEAGETPAEAGARPAGIAGGLAGDSAAPKLYASLPGKGGGKGDTASAGAGGAGSGPGGYDGPAFDGGSGAAKGSGSGAGGGLDAFRSGGAAKGLDSALEGERSGGAGSYGAQMSKSAAGVAAGGSGAGSGAGGGAVPDASKAENASASGGSSSSSPSSSSPSSSSPGSSYSRSSDGDEESTYYGGGSQTPQTKAADDALLKAVVTERLNGGEDKYVTPEDVRDGVDKSLLAPGASPKDSVTKSAGEEKPQPDPESFPALHESRREELKKEVHVLLKRVETDYGAMKDIQFYSCAAYPEICKTHGITENFLTMTTGNGASITLGVKYVRKRWRTYTLDFRDPSGAKPAPSGKPGAISTGVYGDDVGDEDDEDEEGDY